MCGGKRSSDGDFPETWRQLFSRSASIFSDIFTDETAAFFLSRLQVSARHSPDAVLDLFTKSGIGRIPSVGRLIPGWIASIELVNYFSARGAVLTNRSGEILKLIPEECGSISTDNIPVDVLAILQQDDDYDYDQFGTMPGSLKKRHWTVIRVSKIVAAQYIRSLPDLPRTLYFLGFPLYLPFVSLSRLTTSDLQRILPFVLYSDLALADKIKVLIQRGRSDVISAIIQCENFRFGSSKSIYRIMLHLIVIERHHGFLRALLQTKFRDGLLHKVASRTSPIPILHHAVQVRNAAAVRELLLIEGLFDLNLLDNKNRTARSYAEEGSEIAMLLDGPSSV